MIGALADGPSTNHWSAPVPDEISRWTSPTIADRTPTIDLRDPDAPVRTTRVRIDLHESPLLRMTENQRKRLLVRVLCELVAYEEPTVTTGPSALRAGEPSSR